MYFFHPVIYSKYQVSHCQNFFKRGDVMKDNEPNINVPLLASKGEGWEKEWEKIVQYVFVEGADEDKNGISTFLKRRTAFLFNGQEYDEDPKKKEDERSAVCAELFVSLYQKWHDSGVVDFVLPEGTSFFNVCISREILKHTQLKLINKNHSNLEKRVDLSNFDNCPDRRCENHDEKKLIRAQHEKLVRNLEKYCVEAYRNARFPNQNETQAGIQLYDHYSNYPNNTGIGIDALKKTVFEKADEEKIREAVMNAINDWETKIQDAGIRPQKEEDGSNRNTTREDRRNQYEVYQWYCPVRDPDVVHELLGIPVKDVSSHLSRYLKKFLPKLFPDLMEK